MLTSSNASFKLVLIPSWLEEVMRTKQKSLRYCLDIHALSRILSENDVAFYVAINTYLYEHLHAAIKDTFTRADILSPFDYLLPDSTGTYPNEADVHANLDKIRGLVNGQFSLDSNKPSGYNLLDILPHNELLEIKNSPIEISSLNFQLHVLDIDLFGITFSRKDPTENSDKQTKRSLYNALNVMTGLYPFTQIAGTSLFKTFALIGKKFG